MPPPTDARPDESLLAVHVLGGLRLRSHGATVPRPRRRENERLLVYLLLNGAHELDRQAVAFDLWPDMPAEKARYNLRFHLYRLSEALPEPPPDRPWVVRSHLFVRWSPDADAWVDAVAFEALAAATGTGLAADLDALKAAADLYTGDLLPEHDEPWLAVHRDRLRATAGRVLDALGDGLLAARRYAEAVAAAQRRIAFDPDEEVGYRRLMRAYAGHADSGAVARTFEACQAHMRATFGLEPSAETVALAAALLAGGQAPAGAGRDVRSATGGAGDGAGDGAGGPVDIAPLGDAFADGRALPAPVTRFVGREDEIAGLKQLLREHRLVTIVGPGGAGKTRLAIEVLRGLAEEGATVRWTELAELPTGAPVVPTVGQAIGATLRSAADAADLVAAIGDAPLVLALDNCEHVTDGARAVVDALLAGCPGVTVLATSREPLAAQGERRWKIASLPTEAGTEAAAVALFLDRTLAVDATWRPTTEDVRAIGGICRLLDGMPLAIEIAAARTVLFTVPELARALEGSVAALEDGAAGGGRQRTLAASVGWSYDLLADDERTALTRLAVFPGSFDLAAASAVAGAAPLMAPGTVGIVARLIEKSLLTAVEATAAGRRFRLAKPVAEFLDERLAEDERAACRARHATHFQAVVAPLRERPDTMLRPEEVEALQPDQMNFDAALTALVDAGDEGAAIGLASALYRYWYSIGQLRYAADRLTDLLAAFPGSPPSVERAKIERAAAGFLELTGELERARDMGRTNVAHWADLGATDIQIDCLCRLSSVHTLLLEFADAVAALDEARVLAKSSEDAVALASVETTQARFDRRIGQFVAAYGRLISFLGRTSEARVGAAYTRAIRYQLALLGLDLSDYARAIEQIRLGVASAEAANDIADLARWHHLEGIVRTEVGDYGAAAAALRLAMDQYRAESTPTMLSWVVHCLGDLALHQGQAAVATAYLDSSIDAKMRANDRHGLVFSLLCRAELALFEGRTTEAAADAARTRDLLGETADPAHVAWCQTVQARTLAAAGRPDEAMRMAEAALGFARTAGTRRRAALALEACAAAAAADDAWAEAVGFVAAAGEVWAAIHAPPPAPSAALVREVLERARGELDPAALEEALAEGRARGGALAEEAEGRLEGAREIGRR